MDRYTASGCVVNRARSVLPLVLLLGLAARETSLFREDFGPGWQDRWKERIFRGKSWSAAVETEAGDFVLRVESDRSAAALFAELPADAAGARELSFRWRIAAPLTSKASERSKRGDDYAARVFVLFDPLPLGRRTRALCYVWARSEPRGSSFASPYFHRVETIVLESRGERVGEWTSERRDFAGDFRAYFHSPPPPVKAVAVMVDTDDTGERDIAWFDDIVLR